METVHRLIFSPKTPTAARILGLYAGLASLALSGLAVAQPAESAALSEADVIRLARERAPAATLADATDALAEARARTAGRLANPALGWDREAVETGPVGTEDALVATLPIDIAGPLTARSLAAAESAWMRAETSLTRTDAVLNAVLAYYRVALAERRVELLSRSVADLDEAARVVARREEIGSASGYDSARIAVASELGRSRLAEARGELESARARLALMLNMEPGALRVSTSLALMSASDEAALGDRGGTSRAAVRLARDAERLAGQAEERADWAWLPALELSGGVKHVSDQGGGYGYIVGVSVDLPIFDRGQALRAEASAQRSLAQARSEALVRAIDSDIASARAAFRSARQELERFESQTSSQVEQMLTAAHSGYREGARSIVELVDAQRAQAEVAERRLSLLGAAKRAEARLRAAAGDLQ
ncbi:MAG: hypothetical protein Tsb0020_19490 [Haliangiales bacterium]